MRDRRSYHFAVISPVEAVLAGRSNGSGNCEAPARSGARPPSWGCARLPGSRSDPGCASGPSSRDDRKTACLLSTGSAARLASRGWAEPSSRSGAGSPGTTSRRADCRTCRSASVESRGRLAKRRSARFSVLPSGPGCARLLSWPMSGAVETLPGSVSAKAALQQMTTKKNRRATGAKRAMTEPPCVRNVARVNRCLFRNLGGRFALDVLQRGLLPRRALPFQALR